MLYAFVGFLLATSLLFAALAYTYRSKYRKACDTLKNRENDLAVSKARYEVSESHIPEKLSSQFRDIAETAIEKHQNKLHEHNEKNLTEQKTVVGNLLDPLKKDLEQTQKNLNNLTDKYIQMQTRAESAMLENLRRIDGKLNLLSPKEQGNWGEFQLRRIVEASGMLRNCHFYEQPSLYEANEDKKHRPDMIVRIPHGSIVVDAKAPLLSHAEIVKAKSKEEKTLKTQEYTKALKHHIRDLGGKSYWEKLDVSPDFTLLFLPGEHYLASALEADPQLTEKSMRYNVILCTPAILLAMLRSMAFLWKQHALGENAKAIAKESSELFKRMQTVLSHIETVGNKAKGTLDAYNALVGSIDSRLSQSFDRLEKLSKTKDTIKLPEAADSKQRILQSKDAS